jgi:hypothetical protein
VLQRNDPKRCGILVIHKEVCPVGVALLVSVVKAKRPDQLDGLSSHLGALIR